MNWYKGRLVPWFLGVYSGMMFMLVLMDVSRGRGLWQDGIIYPLIVGVMASMIALMDYER